MLTSKQKKAIEMMASGQFKQTEIAGRVNVSEQTICNWKKNPEFMAEYDRLIRQGFQTLAAKAFMTQVSLLNAKTEMVRHLAAKDILDRAGYKPDNKIDLGNGVPIIIKDDISDE